MIPDGAWDNRQRDLEELDNIWEFVEGLLSDAALCHEYGRDENAWCDKVVLPVMQRALKGKDMSLFKVDNMYV